ncbi:TPA: multidrug ABC transporter ATPase [Proteus mirabilis]|uniref:multidrug ABC transporter ATPase n=1 Tax=Proteus TaxID=583 RepID=UPI001377CFDD|nr:MULTISPECIES: multidrug ABC transporter ATPase [Proteus]EKV9970562.1 multidrug ABC transporter ATPase [Proteus mirabilis]EKX2217638.1 multidrug ABC transporter ATPase [Proteus mirabilis]ELA7799482.1 multidrug ABC transporter ATPase [Proteus mirabilis]MBG2793809.1 multidrug ABC transporter ATPase [Proteus mirabilis]MBG2978374.1 multidrug ABC transporter ATPase [Proteus mirabilis]
MSLVLGFDFDVGMFNSQDRLIKVLKENRGRYTITKNGYVELDLSNDKVKEAIKGQIDLLKDIKEESQGE